MGRSEKVDQLWYKLVQVGVDRGEHVQLLKAGDGLGLDCWAPRGHD